MKKFIYILFLIQLLSCKVDKKEGLKETTQKTTQKTVIALEEKFVVAKSGLNYRKKPKGEIIGKFEHAKKLEIVVHSAVFETIKDDNEIKKGEWLGAKLNNDTVYVFGAYLSAEKQILKPQTEKTAILLPVTYRDSENENPVNSLNKSWLDLHKKDGNYYISKANYAIKNGEDACTGSKTKTITSKTNTLMLINKPQLTIGEIYAINFDKDKIWPNEKISFKYDTIEYTLRAAGDIISSEKVHTDNGLERFCVVENYKLFIKTGNNEESLFLEEKKFNDTFVKLIFVGDIDADGKLDFVFEANRWYEEKRVLLYLSSEAKDGEIIKKASEIVIHFDC